MGQTKRNGWEFFHPFRFTMPSREINDDDNVSGFYRTYQPWVSLPL